MRRTTVMVRRLVLLALAWSGLLGLARELAQHFMQQQHCEPVLRH